MLCLTEHFGCQFPYLPLCTVTAAYLKEVQKFAGVHGDDYFGLGGIGQQKAGVLEGAFSLIPECLGKFVVPLLNKMHLFNKPRLFAYLFYAGWHNKMESSGFSALLADVTLALLGIRG